MGRQIKTVVAMLGTAGLAQVFEDLFDTPRLVRLANACGLSYPGRRTQTQKRDRLVADLAARAITQEAARREVDRTLRKEIPGLVRQWTARPEDERFRLLADPGALRAERSLGVVLYLGASQSAAGIDDATVARLLAELAATEGPDTSDAADPAPDVLSGLPENGAAQRELARLRKRHAELARKVRHLENQLAKTRDTEKLLRRDLIERKGELAESRMLVERLRKELDGARAATPKSGPAGEDLGVAVRKLAAEQRKLHHAIAALGTAAPPPADLSPVLEVLDAVRADWSAGRDAARSASTRERKALEDLTIELRAVASKLDDLGDRKPRRAAARSSSTPRVGVFVDVQNVFYGARRLKGKLDFDALLAAAVRDRRLILARAYVVESKDIDQSGFIALLQHKAFEVRRKPLQVRADGSMKGDWDMEMAIDMLDEAPQLDVVALVSGDGDFTSLVRRVRSIGPRVEVFGFPRTTAKSLIEVADQFHPLDRRFMIRTLDGSPDLDETETRAS